MSASSAIQNPKEEKLNGKINKKRVEEVWPALEVKVSNHKENIINCALAVDYSFTIVNAGTD